VRSKICWRDIAVDVDALVSLLRFMGASFEAETQTDGLHQLRRAEGFVRERPEDCRCKVNIQFPEASKGNLLEFVNGPIAHVDRGHSAAKLRVASDNVVGAMRNRGSADANALLGRRLDLPADFRAHVAFDVMEIIDEHDVIAATDLADDGIKVGRAVFFAVEVLLSADTPPLMSALASATSGMPPLPPAVADNSPVTFELAVSVLSIGPPIHVSTFDQRSSGVFMLAP
jgi:hypothetical protein